MRGLFYAACVACVSVVGPASAAEASPVADFSGVHLGLQTGYGFGAAGDWCFCSFLPPALDATGGSGGITVGGEVGYGVRLGPFVVEADATFGYASLKFSEPCATNVVCEGQLSWTADADLSAGFVVSDVLVAATAGYVAGDVRARTIGLAGTIDEATSIHEGHVYGGRIEQGMSGGWRFGLEYRYYEMSGDADLTATAGAPTQTGVDWHAHVANLTIRYQLPD